MVNLCDLTFVKSQERQTARNVEVNQQCTQLFRTLKPELVGTKTLYALALQDWSCAPLVQGLY